MKRVSQIALATLRPSSRPLMQGWYDFQQVFHEATPNEEYLQNQREDLKEVNNFVKNFRFFYPGVNYPNVNTEAKEQQEENTENLEEWMDMDGVHHYKGEEVAADDQKGL